MDKILHHLGWLKPYKQWDSHRPWWCRILSINSIREKNEHQSFRDFLSQVEPPAVSDLCHFSSDLYLGLAVED